MTFFDWVKDIEETHKKLLKSVEEKNQEQLGEYKKSQEDRKRLILENKKDYVSKTIENIKKEIKIIINIFDGKFDDCLKKIETDFREKKQEILKSLSEKLEIGF
ncbi:MAG: hypothetical protein GF329_12915 [Candidatus Lokiarchaeota archaeon]|nr:hypothetical protein [Candidatus Lokiarchaeota archaeon]